MHTQQQHIGFVERIASSKFNYWFGYVANLSLVIWLMSKAFRNGQSMIAFSTWMMFILVGFFAWTLSEYLLHMVVYHIIESPAKIGHDLHHHKPKALLGIPWYLTTIILVALFYALAKLFNPFFLGPIMGFIWLGYTGYCLMHHAIHHWKLPFEWFDRLRRHHLVHHARNNGNWGITTIFWDRLFHTQIITKK